MKKIKVSKLPAAKNNPILARSNYALPFDPYEPDESVFFYWAKERHEIYLKRAEGLTRPWTEDPVLANYRFCNVYRQVDVVSEFIYKNMLKPNIDNPYLWFIACIARLINTVDCLKEVINTPGCIPTPEGKWSQEKMFKLLNNRRTNKKQFITGAYIINSVFSEGMDPRAKGNKAGHIALVGLGGIWNSPSRPHSEDFKHTKQHAIRSLQKFNGYGPFIANQVATDLEYMKGWLKNCSDMNTFVTPGPGTVKGVRYVMFNESSGSKIPEKDIIQKLIDIRELQFEYGSKLNPYWNIDSKNMRNGFAEIQLSNISNCSCEVSKLLKIYRGDGEMRSRYSGIEEPSQQKELFGE